ncbi:NUDIX domain-containing protein [Salinarimonas ramus]|nr:NUDIX domain-containing protein [Salinarimonas ramus]
MIKSAAGWIEAEDGRVLMQKRREPEGSWGFPGGIVDLGESVAEAAIREIREETGLDVVPTRLVGIYSKYLVTLANGDRCQTVTSFFACRPVGGRLDRENAESAALRWLAPDALPPLYCEQHRDMARDAAAGATGVFR